MGSRWLVACLALAGCRQIFGLDTPVRLDVDAGVSIDAPDAGPCVAASQTCAGSDILRTCSGPGAAPDDTSCSWGCGDAEVAHCQDLVPAGGVLEPGDLAPTAALLDGNIVSITTINTDTGEITGVRPAGPGVQSGIEFEPRAGGGVFTMKSLTITAGVASVGTRPLVIVALDSMTIASTGRLDLRGTCAGRLAGPGGGLGGVSGGAGAGAGASGGAGGMSGDAAGGGGGGHATAGANGGGPTSGPDGGAAFGTAAIATLVGGGGGGAGGDVQDGGPGGGGGGAVQIVSNGAITIVAGGQINAGGCGGKAPDPTDSGGGGGAGGTILLEAPSVAIDGILAVNGGGGGASEDGTDGTAGRPSRQAAPGGTGPTPDGGDGAAALQGPGIGETGGGGAAGNSGGGGGAIGRIRVNTRTGAATIGSTTVMSPAFDDPATSATQGTAAAK